MNTIQVIEAACAQAMEEAGEGVMEDKNRDILDLIENAEREAEPIARSAFATSNESHLAQTILDLSNAMRLMIGAPERTERPY